MSVTWTAEQRMVIDRRDDNILVSASAGSGKTAVLVRRILAYLTDPEEPCDIDRLLVVTFTRAAAAEMKERIGRAIREALDEDPENAHLQRQSTLIHNAQITTIDGFCSWLVRSYCYRTDLEPGFRVGEEGELKLLSADVMAEVLDAGYGAEDPDFKERFRRLAETFATGKSDKALEEAILKVANAAESQPWPGIWIAECRRNNQAGSMEILESLPWMAHFSAGAERKILEGLALARENLALAESPEGPSAYLAAAQSYAELFEALAETITAESANESLRIVSSNAGSQETSSELSPRNASSNAGRKEASSEISSRNASAHTTAQDVLSEKSVSASDQDEQISVSSYYNMEAAPVRNAMEGSAGRPVSSYVRRQQLLSDFSPDALGRKKASAGEIPELRETFKERRNAIDGVLKQLRAMYAFGENEAVENMQKNEEVLNTLLDAAALYLERYAAKKRERHLVDFSDLEHFALEILRGKPGEMKEAALMGQPNPPATLRETKEFMRPSVTDKESPNLSVAKELRIFSDTKDENPALSEAQDHRMLSKTEAESLTLENLESQDERADRAETSEFGQSAGGNDSFATFASPLILGRTEVAKELAARFREVLVDEYQDSNDLQEAILTAVSRIEDGGRNYFCVGDVKQSIYGFRNAHPDLFMEKFALYTPAKTQTHPSKPAEKAANVPDQKSQKFLTVQDAEKAASVPDQRSRRFLTVQDAEKAASVPDQQSRRFLTVQDAEKTANVPDQKSRRFLTVQDAEKAANVPDQQSQKLLTVQDAQKAAYAPVQEPQELSPEHNSGYFVSNPEKMPASEEAAEHPPLALLDHARFISPARRGTRIDLLKNFRSRREVLSATNAIFRQVMIPAAGGVSYGDDAALVFGAEGYPEDTENRFSAELLAVLSGEKDEDGEDFLEETGTNAKRELEARMIGERILRMVRREKLWDEKTGQMRPTEFRDIVVLLRTMTGWADTFAKVLESMGIRAYSTARSGYFSATEVALILDYLAIVDNPLQDIPLAAVLHSPIVGLDAEELARVRLAFGSPAADKTLTRKSLWECVQEVLANAALESTETAEKLRAFFSFYSEVRAAAPDTPLHEIIWKIYSGTGYFDYASALPGGVQRAANLRMLAEKARDYETTSYVGLSAFIRYINNLKRYEVDLSAAGTVGENENAVRIISIHKSKGLEYPVVFVAGLGKSFNRRELTEKLLVDPADGLAADCTDLGRRAVVPTIKKEAVKLHLLQDMVGEELRVLYVALTRAKQKLILTGTVADEDTYEEMANLPLPLREKTFGAGYILGAKTPMDLIVPAVRRTRQRAELAAKREALGTASEGQTENSCHSAQNGESQKKEKKFPALVEEILVKPSELAVEAVAEQAEEQNIFEFLRQMSPNEVFDPEVRTILEERLTWRYPYADRANIPVKVSVSELKKGFAEDEDSAKAYETPEIIPLVPAFIREREASGLRQSEVREKDELPPAPSAETEKGGQFRDRSGRHPAETPGGAARGIAYHRAMELLRFEDFEIPDGAETTESERAAEPDRKETEQKIEKEILRQLQTFVGSGLMEAGDAAAVDVRDLAAFVRSGLGRRFIRAAKAGKLRREQPFAMEVPAAAIRPDYPSDETILVQGIIDAFLFETEESIVLIDYKTDRVFRPSQLIERYKLQLDAYAEALTRATSLPVAEKIIWSFHLGREIRA